MEDDRSSLEIEQVFGVKLEAIVCEYQYIKFDRKVLSVIKFIPTNKILGLVEDRVDHEIEIWHVELYCLLPRGYLSVRHNQHTRKVYGLSVHKVAE
jgi:hypothetical protein